MHDETTLSLPWYVNRTLDASDNARIARELRTQPALRNEWLFWEELAQAQRAMPAIAEDIALQRTLARIRRESAAEKSARPAAPARGWLPRLRFASDAWLRPALACTLAIVAVQALLLFNPRGDEAARMRGQQPASLSTPASVPANAALLRVVFDPATPEGEIRLLVAGQSAWIVGGPGNGGEYYVAVPVQRVIAITDALRASPAVREVAGVESLPPMP